MSELSTFIVLGFRHIVDVGAMDHLLFLLVLAAIYRLRDTKHVLWVVSAFTVGHSLTLALAVTGAMRLPMALIEFLIPVTIVLTAMENLVVSRRLRAGWHSRYRPVLAGAFGLVHGAGFANYLQALFVDRIALPLIGFNVGIEVGQILVLAMAAALFALADRGLQRLSTSPAWPAVRLRTVGVSVVAGMIAVVWAYQRNPF